MVKPSATATGRTLYYAGRAIAECADEGIAVALAIVMERGVLIMLEPEEEATVRKALGA